MSSSIPIIATLVLGIMGPCGPGTATYQTDAPASSLEIQPTIIDDPNPASGGTVPVLVAFRQDGSSVVLTSQSAVTCNGVALAYNALFGYNGRVPSVAPPGSYTFTLTRSGVDTSVAIQVPQRPAITKPQSGQSVARDANFTIEYVAAAATSVRGSADDGATSVSGASVPDGRAAPVDTTQLKSGPGHCGLARTFQFSPSGTGFAAVTATYTNFAPEVAVTWK